MDGHSRYKETLIRDVLEHSESQIWESAVQEWNILDVEEDEHLEQSCICGKEHLRYLFTISNDLNGNSLYPIGSSCIKKFNREDLNEEISAKEDLFKLLHAVEDNQFLTLSSEFFSRKLLKYLLDIGAFKATKWNNMNPEDDYQFMLDMFNKRNRTESQEKKAIAIILNSIKPFLQNYLKDKVRR